jgi:hypothetical protein
MLQAVRSRVRFQTRTLDSSIVLIFPAAAVDHGVDSASNRNEYQESSMDVSVRKLRLSVTSEYLNRVFNYHGY